VGVSKWLVLNRVGDEVGDPICRDIVGLGGLQAFWRMTRSGISRAGLEMLRNFGGRPMGGRWKMNILRNEEMHMQRNVPVSCRVYCVRQ